MRANIDEMVGRVEKYTLVNGEHIPPLTKSQKRQLRRLFKSVAKKIEGKTNDSEKMGPPYYEVMHIQMLGILHICVFDELTFEQPIIPEY